MAEIKRNPQVFSYPRHHPPTDFTANKTSISQGEQVQFTDNSADAVEWYWNFGDGSTSTQQNPTHTFQGSGGATYTVQLIIKDQHDRVGILIKENFIQVQVNN